MLQFTSQLVLAVAVAAQNSNNETLFNDGILIKHGSRISHSTNSKGKFLHPFANAGPEVTAIHYPDEKSFSIKLNKFSSGQDEPIVTDKRLLQIEHKLGIQSEQYQSDLDNIFNGAYFGSIGVGTPIQILPSVGFDTAKGETMIETEKCNNCDGQTYDSTKSSTYAEIVPVSMSGLSKPFSSQGTTATDKFCFNTNKNSCTDNLEFLALSEKGPEFSKYHDGVIGMWFGQKSGGRTNLFVPSLKRDDRLAYSAFSIYLGFEDEDSYIDFGQQSKNFDNQDEYFEIPATSGEDEWSNFVTGIKLSGEKSISYPLLNGPLKAYLDSGNSYISGPSSWIDELYTDILSFTNSQKNKTHGDIFDCDDRENMPSISFKFGGKWMEVTAASYAQETSTGSNECFLSLSGSDKIDFWILGIPFMRQWYTTFDYEKNSMGFVRNPDFQSNEEDDSAEEELGEAQWYDYVSVAGGVSLSVSVFVYLYLNGKL